MRCTKQKKPQISRDAPPKYKPRRTKKCESDNNLSSLLLPLLHRFSNSCPLRLNSIFPSYLISSWFLLLSTPSTIECISTRLRRLLINHSPLLSALPQALFVCMSTPFLPFSYISFTQCPILVPPIVLRQHLHVLSSKRIAV